MDRSPADFQAIVIDASVGVLSVLEGPLSRMVERKWEGWLQEDVTIFAPRLWLNELTSALHKIYRLGEISETSALSALDAALTLGVELVDEDADLCRQAYRWASRLGQLATYDAFYLALAERLNATPGASLWTADQRLAKRAQQIGVNWVHWIGEYPD